MYLDKKKWNQVLRVVDIFALLVLLIFVGLIASHAYKIGIDDADRGENERVGFSYPPLVADFVAVVVIVLWLFLRVVKRREQEEWEF